MKSVECYLQLFGFADVSVRSVIVSVNNGVRHLCRCNNGMLSQRRVSATQASPTQTVKSQRPHMVSIPSVRRQDGGSFFSHQEFAIGNATVSDESLTSLRRCDRGKLANFIGLGHRRAVRNDLEDQ